MLDDAQFQEIVNRIMKDPVKVAFIGAAMGAGRALGSKALGMGAAAGKAVGNVAARSGKDTMGLVEKGLGRVSPKAQQAFQTGQKGVAGRLGKMQGLQQPVTQQFHGGRTLQQAVGGGVLGGGTLAASSLSSPKTASKAKGLRRATLKKDMEKDAALPNPFSKLPKLPKPDQFGQNLAEATSLAAILGSGTLLSKMVLNNLFGNEDVIKEVNKETGKINAKQIFKGQMLIALKPRHNLVFNMLTKEDDIISKADKKQMKSTFETMKRFAPNLAADENAARSFLREHATYDTGPNYATLKSLADAEKMIVDAGGSLAGTLK